MDPLLEPPKVTRTADTMSFPQRIVSDFQPLDPCSHMSVSFSSQVVTADAVPLDHPPPSTGRVSSTKPGLVPQGGGHRSLDGGGTHSQAHGGYQCKLIPWG